MGNHCNSYGFSGGFAAICAAISWYLVQDRSCKINIVHVLSETFSKYSFRPLIAVEQTRPDQSWVSTTETNLSLTIESQPVEPEHLQMFHYIAIIVGVVLFVLSFFDFAGILYEVTLLFVVAAIGIFASAAMMLYATYMAFHMSCKSAFNSGFDTASLFSGAKNVIEANDEVGIVIMVLDLLCACMLISAAISFSRTYWGRPVNYLTNQQTNEDPS